MTQYPYILFNKSPEQLRLLGAQGGRAYGRNRRRARRTLLPTSTSPSILTPPVASAESVAKAMRLLDTQFPWLQGAEKQTARKPKQTKTPARSDADLTAPESSVAQAITG